MLYIYFVMVFVIVHSFNRRTIIGSLSQLTDSHFAKYQDCFLNDVNF